MKIYRSITVIKVIVNEKWVYSQRFGLEIFLLVSPWLEISFDALLDENLISFQTLYFDSCYLLENIKVSKNKVTLKRAIDISENLTVRFVRRVDGCYFVCTIALQ